MCLEIMYLGTPLGIIVAPEWPRANALNQMRHDVAREWTLAKRKKAIKIARNVLPL